MFIRRWLARRSNRLLNDLFEKNLDLLSTAAEIMVEFSFEACGRGSRASEQ